MVVLQPTSLPQAIGMAKLLEANFHDHRTPFNGQTRTPPLANPSPSNLCPAQPLTPFPIHRLSPAEQSERRAKGLCFNCDDKFSPSHKSQSKQFLLLLTEDDTINTPDLPILEPSLKEPDPTIHLDTSPTPMSISNFLKPRYSALLPHEHYVCMVL